MRSMSLSGRGKWGGGKVAPNPSRILEKEKKKKKGNNMIWPKLSLHPSRQST